MMKWLSRGVASVGPVRFFVVVSAIFGMFFLLVTPPFQGADEIVHFYRSYQISEGNVIADKNPQGKIGGELPSSLREIVAKTDATSITFYPQIKSDVYLTREAFAIPNNTEKTKFYEFSAAAPYSPAAYLGVSPGIAVARFLHLPTAAAFYAGRLGNLIAWAALVGAAIYFLPRRKWVMVAVGLLPMALFQASTINGDAVTLGSLALFIALILNFRERVGNLSKKELAALMLVAIIMVLTKQVMFVFLPLIFLLKKPSFGSKKSAVFWKVLLVVVPLVCFLGWMLLIRDVSTVTAYNNNQNPIAQLEFILRNPHSYINVLWNTYFYTWGDGITRSFVGTFGWADAPLSELIVTIGYIGLAVLFFSSTSRERAEWLNKKEKILLWAMIFLYWAAVSTVLYMSYSPLGYKIVYGLQGRYFLPIALLALPLLMTKFIRVDDRLYKHTAVLLPLFLLVASAITLYVRYYVNNV